MIILHISTTALWDAAALSPFIPTLSVHLSVHTHKQSPDTIKLNINMSDSNIICYFYIFFVLLVAFFVFWF